MGLNTFFSQMKARVDGLTPLVDTVGAKRALGGAPPPSDVQDGYHLSLSRSVPVTFEQIDALVGALHRLLAPTSSFTVKMAGPRVFINDQRTRTFLALGVQSGAEQACGIIRRVDAAFQGLGLQPFHQEPHPPTSRPYPDPSLNGTYPTPPLPYPTHLPGPDSGRGVPSPQQQPPMPQGSAPVWVPHPGQNGTHPYPHVHPGAYVVANGYADPTQQPSNGFAASSGRSNGVPPGPQGAVVAMWGGAGAWSSNGKHDGDSQDLQGTVQQGIGEGQLGEQRQQRQQQQQQPEQHREQSTQEEES